jgi:hypothetical protein
MPTRIRLKMSKKPKLRRMNAYKLLRGTHHLFDDKDLAISTRLDYSWKFRHSTRTILPDEKLLVAGDVFVLLQASYSGTGIAVLKVIPPSGHIGYFSLVDRSSIQMVFNHRKERLPNGDELPSVDSSG